MPNLREKIEASVAARLAGHSPAQELGRYKAFLIDKELYYRRVLRYIVLNPVRARLVVHPGQWRWSSYLATAGFIEPPPWLALDDVWKIFHSDDVQGAQRIYDELVCHELSRGGTKVPKPVAVASDQLAVRITDAIAPHWNVDEFRYAERFAVRPPLDILLAADEMESRDIALREAFEYYGYTLRQIADAIGRHPCTVWRRIRRVASGG